MLRLAYTLNQSRAVAIIQSQGYCPDFMCDDSEWQELVTNCQCWHDTPNRQYCKHTPTRQPGWEECLADEAAAVQRAGGEAAYLLREMMVEDSTNSERLIRNGMMQR